MKKQALEVFEIIFEKIVEYCRNCGKTQSYFELAPDEKYTLYFYYDDFHDNNEFQAFYNSMDLRNMINGVPEEDFSLLSSRGYLKMRSNLEVKDLSHMMSFFQTSGYTVRALSKRDEYRYQGILSAVNWLESLSLACDGMCRLIGNSISPDLLKQIIFFDMFFDKQFSKSFNNLLLSLMADQPFKMTAGIAYTNAYQTLCRDFSKGHGLSGSTMFNLSVQFLNREVFVHEICYHYSFLQEAIQALNDILTYPRNPEATYFNLPTIKYRRYGSIIGDLKVR
jgi:hypothetical protein